MKRFTERIEDGRNILRKGILDIFKVGFGRFFDGEAVDKLAEYEDLEEQGKFLRLPCKVGDIIWQTKKVFDEFPYFPYPIKVSGFSVCENGTYLEGIYGEENRGCSILISQVGKTVFLSKEQAESALNGMKEREG